MLNNASKAKLDDLLATLSEIETEKKRSEHSMAREMEASARAERGRKAAEERAKWREEHPDEEEDDPPVDEEEQVEEDTVIDVAITLENINTVTEES